MAAPRRFNRIMWGADEYVRALSNGAATAVAMATLNTGWCARFAAIDTRDIASVWVNWSSVAAAGTVQLRIETVDATTGKPTGTLYDANAVLSFTPAAGWQQLTFAVLPTAGLVAGTEYAIVLLTTVGGTTQTIRSHTAIPNGSYPAAILTAADGTTRSNFAEVGGATPILTLVMEDGVEEVLNFNPFTATTAYNAFGNAAIGVKLIVPTGVTLKVAAYDIGNLTRQGTPAGDLRVRLFNSSDGAVSGSTITVDKDSLAGIASRRSRIPIQLSSPLSLAAGTYRLILDSSGSANSSNCWRLNVPGARVAGNVPSGFIGTQTADLTAGPIVWTDTATDEPPLALVLDDVIGGSGGLPLGRTVGGL